MIEIAKLLLVLIEIVRNVRADYKEAQHEKNVEKITSDPSGAWIGKFGRVRSDSGEESGVRSADSSEPPRSE